MRRRVAVVLLAGAGVFGVLAPSAFGSANREQANCLALFVSGEDQEPGDVGDSASSNAQEADAHPFGLNVISFTAHMRAAECGE